MGDRLATIDMGRKVRGCCAPFCGAGLGSHLIQCCLAEAYIRTKWHLGPSNRLAIISLHQRYTDKQTGQIEQRSHSIRRTVTCNGRPKTAEPIEMAFGVCTLVGRRKHALDGGAHCRNLTITIEPNICGGDGRPFCQVTMTTCFLGVACALGLGAAAGLVL